MICTASVREETTRCGSDRNSGPWLGPMASCDETAALRTSSRWGRSVFSTQVHSSGRSAPTPPEKGNHREGADGTEKKRRRLSQVETSARSTAMASTTTGTKPRRLQVGRPPDWESA